MKTSFNFKPITKNVRAGRRGKHILCPNCGTIHKVYHFSWSGLGCQSCGRMIDKLLWYTETATNE